MTAKLPAGPYRAVVETKDAFGKAVTARRQLDVLDPEAGTFAIKVPNLVAAPKWSLEPGEEFLALWGTGYDSGRAFVEVEHRGKIAPGVLDATGQDAGDREGGRHRGDARRVHRPRHAGPREPGVPDQHRVDVPWTNKDLTVKWEHFVSKLEPGKKETFTAVVTGPDAKRAVAEMVAALYDASLDAYLPHDWMHQLRRLPPGLLQLAVALREPAAAARVVQGQLAGPDGPRGPAVPPVPARPDGEPVRLPVLRPQRGAAHGRRAMPPGAADAHGRGGGPGRPPQIAAGRGPGRGGLPQGRRQGRAVRTAGERRRGQERPRRRRGRRAAGRTWTTWPPARTSTRRPSSSRTSRPTPRARSAWSSPCRRR